MVGYLMVCLSVSAGIFAYLMGVLQKYVGRAVLILSGMFLSSSINTFVFLLNIVG